MINTRRIYPLFSAAIIFCIGIFAAVSPGQSRADRQAADKLVGEGERAAQQRNYANAIENYSKAIALVPNHATAHFRKGVAHNQLKQFDLAVTSFNDSLKYGYKEDDVLRARWESLLETKDFDGALRDLNAALKDDPNDLWLLRGVAKVSFERGDYTGAIAAYQKILPRVPNKGDVHYDIALAKSKMGDVDGQIASAEEAIRANTLFLSDAWLLIGAGRHIQKRIPEAIDAYSRALASKPDKYQAYRQLAELYRSQNMIDDAINISREALTLYPTDGYIYTDLSWFYSLAGRTDDAIAAGRSATQLLPKEHMGYTNLCRAYIEAAKSELAVSSCNSALRLKPGDGETLFYLGRGHTQMRKLAEAERYYKQAVAGLIEFTRANPDYSDGYYLLGNAYAEVGDNANAVAAYKKCLDLNPRFSKANFNIGIIRIIERDKDGAMAQYNALLTVDKGLAEKLKAEIDKM